MGMIDRLKQKIQQLEGVPTSLLGIAGVTRTPPPQVQRAAPVQHAVPEPIVRETVQAPSPQRPSFEPVQHATPRDLEQSTYNPQGPRSARQVVQAPTVQRQGFEPFQRVQHATPPPIVRQTVQAPKVGSRPPKYLPEPQFQQPAPRQFNPAGKGGVYYGAEEGIAAQPSPTAEIGGEQVRIARSQPETAMPNPTGLGRQQAAHSFEAEEAKAATASALPGGRMKLLTRLAPLALAVGGAIYSKLRAEPPKEGVAGEGKPKTAAPASKAAPAAQGSPEAQQLNGLSRMSDGTFPGQAEFMRREGATAQGIAAPAQPKKGTAKKQGGGGKARGKGEVPGLAFTPQQFAPETDAGTLMAAYTDPQAGVREGLANPAPDVAAVEDSAANVAERERIAALEAQQIPSFQLFRGERGEMSFAAPNADGTMPEVVIPGKMRTPAGITYKEFEDKAYPEIEDRRLKREGIAAQTKKFNAEADAEPIKAKADMKRAQADADSVGAKYITARAYAKMAENGGDGTGSGGTKGFKERVKMHFNNIKDRNLPEQFTGQHARIAEIMALADTPGSDVGIYYNPGTPGRGGIATRRSTFDAKINKYRQAGYPDKDALAHAFGELQPGEYEPFPNLDRLPDRQKKPAAASIDSLLEE